MPFVADLAQLAHDLVDTLGPYLQRWDFSDTNSGSDHWSLGMTAARMNHWANETTVETLVGDAVEASVGAAGAAPGPGR